MRSVKRALAYVAVACGLLPLAVGAAPLGVFNATCTVVVTDSIGNVTPPADLGIGRLQPRTYAGIAPAAGRMAFEYRIDLTAVTAPVTQNCVTKMQIKFDPIVKEPYPPAPSKTSLY